MRRRDFIKVAAGSAIGRYDAVMAIPDLFTVEPAK
jgi:hypothetical protein